MRTSLRMQGSLALLAFKRAWRDQRGAYAITNRNFELLDSAWIPSCHTELADLTLATAGSTVTAATVNTGIVGLKWMRVRANLKTLGGLAAGETWVVTVVVGTGAALTAPEQIIFSSQVMLAGVTGGLTVDIVGWSQNGFQSWALTTSSSGTSRTSVIDVMVDAA